MTLKPRPARRGYVILVILAGIIFYAGVGGMHWSFARTALVAAGGILVCSGVQLRHRGINREIKNRK